MSLRYVYSDQPVAEGARDLFLDGGRMFVRTGIVARDADGVTYRLREVYDDSVGRPDDPEPDPGANRAPQVVNPEIALQVPTGEGDRQ